MIFVNFGRKVFRRCIATAGCGGVVANTTIIDAAATAARGIDRVVVTYGSIAGTVNVVGINVVGCDASLP